jgi:hypothetical protein
VLALGTCGLQLTIRFLSLGIEGSSVLIFQHTPAAKSSERRSAARIILEDPFQGWGVRRSSSSPAFL